MDIILDALSKSIIHMQLLDKVFSKEDYPEKPEYLWLKKQIKTLNEQGKTKFTEELYVGGKEKPRAPKYSRVMILSDIVTYIISGRGYFYAVKSEENMSNFIRLILVFVNQLMLFDSLTTNVQLRKRFLKTLEESFDETDLFKDDCMRKEHEALVSYDGPIGFPITEFNPTNTLFQKLEEENAEKCQEMLENYYDSLLPKALGLWGELLTYAYLLRQKVGYVLPLLLTQQLISGYPRKKLAVPDILVIPFHIEKDRIFGIEIGGGKETQSTEFFAITGITAATKANANNPKRCTICGKWMLFCPVAIERYSDLKYEITKLSSPIKCVNECDKFSKEQILAGECPYAMHKGGNPENVIMKMESSKSAGDTYHFHLRCILNDPRGSQNIDETKILTYYPFVGGLEKVEKSIENKDLIIKKLRKALKEKEKIINNLEKTGQRTLA